VQSEKTIQAAIRKYLKSIGAHVINTTVVSPSGTADLICCYQSKFYAIECKTKKGSESELQAYQRKQVIKAGGQSIVARGVDDVKALFTHKV